MDIDDIKRFHTKYTKSDSCWEWQKGTNSQGYGQFWLDRRNITAHRVSFLIHYGYLPINNRMVLHKCNNPKCVNPSHLYDGSQHDNMHDRVVAGHHPMRHIRHVVPIRNIKRLMTIEDFFNPYY